MNTYVRTYTENISDFSDNTLKLETAKIFETIYNNLCHHHRREEKQKICMIYRYTQ